MSRGYKGYMFTCKVCGDQHLLDGATPHKGIMVPCVKSKCAIREYQKSDFIFWSGTFGQVCEIIVNEAEE